MPCKKGGKVLGSTLKNIYMRFSRSSVSFFFYLVMLLITLFL